MSLSEKLVECSNINGDDCQPLHAHIEQAKAMESLLKEAAELFRFYEDSHRKRGPEHLEKAERNAEIATRIEAALAN